MSFEVDATQLKKMFETDVFKPATPAEVSKRRVDGPTPCAGCGRPMPDSRTQLQCDVCGGTFCGNCAMEYRNGTACVDCSTEQDTDESKKIKEDVFEPASREEWTKRLGTAQYKTLNDVFAPGPIEIWYWKSTSTDTEHGQEANFLMGFAWCQKKGVLPDPNNLEKTHVLLGKIGKPEHPDEIYVHLQGDSWSPNGEARQLIDSKGLHHTSMSMGDIIKIGDRVLFTDMVGFVDLNRPEEGIISESDEVFKAATEDELRQRPGYLDAQRREAAQNIAHEERRARREARMRTRPDQRNLIDQWVRHGRDKGRASSLKVQGDVLISYGTPIAIRKDEEGGRVVYMVDQRFSVTTSKQQGFVRRSGGGAEIRSIPVAEFKRMLDEMGVYYGSSWLREGSKVFKAATRADVKKRQEEGPQILTYHVFDWDDDSNSTDDWFHSYDVAEAYAKKLVRDGWDRVRIEELEEEDQDPGDLIWSGGGSKDDDYGPSDYTREQAEADTGLKGVTEAEVFKPAGKEELKQRQAGQRAAIDKELERAKAEGKEIKFGPGMYWVGDIGYVMNEDTYDWWLNHVSDQEVAYYPRRAEGPGVDSDVKFAAASTAYGDGLFTGTDGRQYAVDAGNIGVVPASLTDPDVKKGAYQSGPRKGTSLGRWIEVKRGLTFLVHDGVFVIMADGNKIVIDTLTESVNEEEVFKPAGEAELRARGSYQLFPRTGNFEYKFLKHIDNPNEDRTWKVVGFGRYIDYELSDVFFYKDGEPEFNFVYNAEAVFAENMEFDGKLTAEVQAFNESEEEWVKSKGWTVEYKGYTGNEDPAYFWGHPEFGYVSFTAKDDRIMGGAVITFRGHKPVVYAGDLDDVVGQLSIGDPKAEIANLFGYEYFENLVYDMKKYNGTLTEEDEKKHATQASERVPGQMRFDFRPESDSTSYSESVNEQDEDIFKPASKDDLTARRAEYTRLELERKAKAAAAKKAYYAGIPYTYGDIKDLPAYKKIVAMEGVTDITTPLQKAHKTTAFKLSYTDNATKTPQAVPYYVYANGYLRTASGFDKTRAIQKNSPALTAAAYDTLLEDIAVVISRKIEAERAKPPFKTLYACQFCSKDLGYDRWAPQHHYGTKLGNEHLKEPDNHMELERLRGLATAAGVKLEL